MVRELDGLVWREQIDKRKNGNISLQCLDKKTTSVKKDENRLTYIHRPLSRE